MSTPAVLRPAMAADIPSLLAIDQAASALFRGTGLLPSEEPDPHLAQQLAVGIAADLCRVAVASDGAPLGFALCREEGTDLYLDQISVDPSAMRQGLGRQLMAWCDEAASERGLCRVVLSTFRDVAWNGVWYARLGFDELRRRQILPWMAAIEHAQAAAGLDITRRCFMARAVGR